VNYYIKGLFIKSVWQVYTLPSIIGLDGVIYAQVIADLLTTVLAALVAANLQKQIKVLVNYEMTERRKVIEN
jgi:hypothetical protein